MYGHAQAFILGIAILVIILTTIHQFISINIKLPSHMIRTFAERIGENPTYTMTRTFDKCVSPVIKLLVELETVMISIF